MFDNELQKNISKCSHQILYLCARMNKQDLKNIWPFLAFFSPCITAGIIMVLLPPEAEGFWQTANPFLHIEMWGEIIAKFNKNPFGWVTLVFVLTYIRWKNIFTGFLLLLVFHAFSMVGLYALMAIMR